MENKSMDKKQFAILISLGVVIFGVLFCWYSYRPYYVTKLCFASAVNKVIEIEGDQTDMRYFLWKCQKQHGLPE